MRLTLFMGTISLIASLSINLYLTDTRKDWLEQSTLGGNRILLNTFTAWIHTFLVLTFSLAAMYTISEMRDEARQLYQDSHKEKSKLKDFEWLKARTLHVRGLLP